MLAYHPQPWVWPCPRPPYLPHPRRRLPKLRGVVQKVLAGEIEQCRRLATTGDHATAAEASQGAAQIVVMIAHLVAVVTAMGAAGR